MGEAIHITQDIPFNRFLGVTESDDANYLLQIEPQEHHLNHVGSVHAAVLFALAEATSGDYLLKRRDDRTDINGLLRRSTSKYSNPAHGKILASATVSEAAFDKMVTTVDTKGKALLDIAVSLDDTNQVTVASFSFTWLLAKT